MFGFSALSEGPISATVEVAGPVATITRQVGALGASAIGVHAVGRASVTEIAGYDDQYVENGYWEAGYADGDLGNAAVDQTADVALPTVTLTGPAAAVAANSNVLVQSSLPDLVLSAPLISVSAGASATAIVQLATLTISPPQITSSGNATVVIDAVEATETSAPESAETGTAEAAQEAFIALALTPAESSASGAAEATFADLLDVGISAPEAVAGISVTASAQGVTLTLVARELDTTNIALANVYNQSQVTRTLTPLELTPSITLPTLPSNVTLVRYWADWKNYYLTVLGSLSGTSNSTDHWVQRYEIDPATGALTQTSKKYESIVYSDTYSWENADAFLEFEPFNRNTNYLTTIHIPTNASLSTGTFAGSNIVNWPVSHNADDLENYYLGSTFSSTWFALPRTVLAQIGDNSSIIDTYFFKGYIPGNPDVPDRPWLVYHIYNSANSQDELWFTTKPISQQDNDNDPEPLPFRYYSGSRATATSLLANIQSNVEHTQNPSVFGYTPNSDENSIEYVNKLQDLSPTLRLFDAAVSVADETLHFLAVTAPAVAAEGVIANPAFVAIDAPGLTTSAPTSSATGNGAVSTDVSQLTLVPPSAEPTFGANAKNNTLLRLDTSAPTSYETVVEIPLPTPVIQTTAPLALASGGATIGVGAANQNIELVSPNPSVTSSSEALSELPSISVSAAEASAIGNSSVEYELPAILLLPPQPAVQAGVSQTTVVGELTVTAPEPTNSFGFTVDVGGATLAVSPPTAGVTVFIEATADLTQITLSEPEASTLVSANVSTALPSLSVTAPIASLTGDASKTPLAIDALITSPPQVQAGAGAGAAASLPEIAVSTPQVSVALVSDVRTALPSLQTTAPEAAVNISVAPATLQGTTLFVSRLDVETSLLTARDLPNLFIDPPTPIVVTTDDVLASPTLPTIDVNAPVADAKETRDATANTAVDTLIVTPAEPNISASVTVAINDLQQLTIPKPLPEAKLFDVTGDANTGTEAGTTVDIAGLNAKAQLDAFETADLPLLFTVEPSVEAIGTANAEAQLTQLTLIAPQATAQGDGNALAEIDAITLSAPQALAIINQSVDIKLAPYYLQTAVNARPAVVNANPGNTDDVVVEITDRSYAVSDDIPNVSGYPDFLVGDGVDPLDIANRYVVSRGPSGFVTSATSGKQAATVTLYLYRLDFSEGGNATPVLVDEQLIISNYYDFARFSSAAMTMSTGTGTNTVYGMVPGYATTNTNGVIDRYFGGSGFAVDIETETISSNGRNFVTYSSLDRENGYSSATDEAYRFNRKTYVFKIPDKKFSSSRYEVRVGTATVVRDTTYGFVGSYDASPYLRVSDVHAQRQARFYFDIRDVDVQVENGGFNFYPPLIDSPLKGNAVNVPVLNGNDTTLTIASSSLRVQASVSHEIEVEIPPLTIIPPELDYDGNGDAETFAINQLELFPRIDNALTISNICRARNQQGILTIVPPLAQALGGITALGLPQIEVIAPDVSVSVETFIEVPDLELISPETEFAADGAAVTAAIRTITISAPTVDAGTRVEIADLPTIVFNPFNAPFAAQGDVGTLVEVTPGDELKADIIPAEPGVSLSQILSVAVEYNLELTAPSAFAFQAQAIPDFVINVENEVRFIEVAEEIRTAEVEPETRIIEVV